MEELDKRVCLQKFYQIVDQDADFFRKLFYHIKKEKLHHSQKLDYEDVQTLEKKWRYENLTKSRLSLGLSLLHAMVYGLMTTDTGLEDPVENNYYFKLNGKEEMIVLKKDIIYYIFVSIKTEKNFVFHLFILLYSLESLYHHNFYLGIDFEKTNNKIQLTQLNFEHHEDTRSIIMIINPNELTDNMLNTYINLVYCNKYIKKILHGPDSSDLPYIYNTLLQNQNDKIIQFTRTMIDTRFLCEYYKTNLETGADNKCSIYDMDASHSAVFYFGLISEKKQRELSELLDLMPADIPWNIHKLPRNKFLYAQYDVIFLKYFYYRIIYLAEQRGTPAEHRAIVKLYKHVLYELTQFFYLEKRNITNLLVECKKEIDPLNNYMIHYGGTVEKLIDLYKSMTSGIVTTDPKAEIDKLLKVSYYKNNLTILIKKLFYNGLSEKCKIYKDKKTIWVTTTPPDYLFDFFQKSKYTYLLHFFREIKIILDTRIRQRFSK